MAETKESISSSLAIPARLDHLGPVLAYARELAESAGFAKQERDELELAIDEIFTNIVQHGYEFNAGETFQVRFEVSAAKYTVTFAEKGLPFDPATLPQYTPEHAADCTRGLGIFLARKLVDEVTFRYLGRQGKETVLVKRFRQQRSMLAENAGLPERKPPTDFSYHVRRFRAEDAMSVARCAYRAYGYTYSEYVYEPAQLIEQNRSGSLISILAIAEADNEVVGYGDVRFFGAIAEYESGFVAPEWRGKRVIQKILADLVEQSRCNNMLGHFTMSVTNHVASQSASHSIGLADCCVFLGYMAETDFKAIAQMTSRRISLVMQFGMLQERHPALIFPPSHHRSMVEKIYTNLKTPVICGEGGKPPELPQQPTLYKLEIKSDMNIAFLRIRSCGVDAIDIIREQTEQCCRHVVEVVFLALNLQQPAVCSVIAAAEEIGFVFAGVVPAGLEDSDAIVFQLVNFPVEWDRIQLASPFAKELLAYIRQESERSEPMGNHHGD